VKDASLALAAGAATQIGEIYAIGRQYGEALAYISPTA